ncbi:hypothetical protein TNCV_2302811 [Trichonephila clavipes]|nr:hypothetical protein TNCV_2302811 [Trichonephila clavipes]
MDKEELLNVVWFRIVLLKFCRNKILKGLKRRPWLMCSESGVPAEMSASAEAQNHKISTRVAIEWEVDKQYRSNQKQCGGWQCVLKGLQGSNPMNPIS